jgi:hypothetical protein
MGIGRRGRTGGFTTTTTGGEKKNGEPKKNPELKHPGAEAPNQKGCQKPKVLKP